MSNPWESFIELACQAGTSPKAIKPMYAAYGRKPEETCGGCAHCLGMHSNTKTYFKCELMPITHGAGSDIRKKWAACGKWAKK